MCVVCVRVVGVYACVVFVCECGVVCVLCVWGFCACVWCVFVAYL